MTAALGDPVRAPYPREPVPTVFEENVPMTARDGTVLYADITRPDLEGTFPAILSRTPYAKLGADFNRHCHYYAQWGYVTVMQDCRGRFQSEGEYEPIFNEAADGYDAVEWAARLPWCNGRVGMSGQSYLAMTQYALLANDSLPPSLQVMAPLSASSDPHASWTFHTGGPSMFEWLVPYAIHKGRHTLVRHGREDLLARMESYVQFDPTAFAPPLRDEWYRHLPISDWNDLLAEAAPYFAEHIAHPDDGAFWWRANVGRHARKATVPMLHASSWYDIFSAGAPAAYAAIAEQAPDSPQLLVLGPWVHASYVNPSPVVGAVDLGPEAVALDMHALQVRWFDHWLKDIDTGLLDEPPVRAYTLGTGEWERFDTWPPPARVEQWYLHSGGAANTLEGDGALDRRAPATEPDDRFRYDPADPVPTAGGNNLSIPAGMADQSAVERRPDVLVYSSSALAEPLAVAGPVLVELWAASSCVDTDFTAKLVDVHSDGTPWNVVDGVIRARYRTSATSGELMVPGTVYRFTIELGHVSIVFGAGHRLRLEISSSNFPHFDRNLNTGEAFGTGAEPAVADQRVCHRQGAASALLLPVRIDASAGTS